MSPQPEPVTSVSRALTQRSLMFVLRNVVWSIQLSSSVLLLWSSSHLLFFSFDLAEDSVSCENPGLPENGYQILSKRLYLPSESLTFVCYQGYELIGEVAIKCILGNPSFWSGPLPLCRGENLTGLFDFNVQTFQPWYKSIGPSSFCCRTGRLVA